MYKSISIQEFKNILKSNINLIDIRNNTLHKLGNIPYSKNINKNELMFNTEKYLNKNTQYYIYCEKGIQSKNLVEYLNNMGYNTINITGGYLLYKSHK